MLITHKKLQPVQCYHIFSNSMVVYLAKKSLWQLFPSDGTDQPPWLMAYHYQQQKGDDTKSLLGVLLLGCDMVIANNE